MSVRPYPAGLAPAPWLAWLLLCLFLALGLLPRAHALSEEDFLPPEQAFRYSAQMADPQTVLVRFEVAPGYYMYRDNFRVALDGGPGTQLGQVQYPPGVVKYDPTFEKDMEVYPQSFALRVALGPAAGPATLMVTSQGCADAGLCYPPMDSATRLEPDGSGGYRIAQSLPVVEGGRAAWQGGGGMSQAASGAPGWLQAGDVGLAETLARSNWLATAGAFFVLGLLLAFTPCVLPMVPILSSLLVGKGSAPVTRRRGLALAALYVLGMSVVYTALGVAAGLSGAGLAAWLQTPWVLGVFALLLAVLALAMFDVFTFQAPAALQTRLSEKLSRMPGGHGAGALVMGAVSALIVGPCVAAPLAGALLYLSQTGDVLTGALALFALAWGMGVPLLLVGASAGALLPRAGAWMEGVKRFFGMLLLATAWWMLAPVLPAWVQMLGWLALAAAGAVMLGAFEPLPRPAGVGRLFAKALGLLLALAAVLLGVGLASGGRDLLQPLSHLAASSGAPGGAQPAGVAGIKERFVRVRSNEELDALLAGSTQPVMLDFYADWCIACKEMERFTFTDPAVADRMSRMLLVQADVTANTPEDRALLKRFRLFGPPGIVFFAPGGALIPDARVVGFQGANRFLAVLERVQQD
ncbi:protein-disulfide reductase DsbD [Orrella sp. JC864]|uniref:protein-disulfide reductase DsbD n=1 Tax=Orrella sp. JC864 TaxID=3120298 RepID=UPI00300BEBAA